MLVHIIGPNLPDQTKGDFHVHAKGCADVTRNRDYQAPDFDQDREMTWDVASQLDAATMVYGDQIAERSMTAEDGVHDMHFFPCTDALPYEKEHTFNYKEIADVLTAGLHPDTEKFRIKVFGVSNSKFLSITPDQLTRIATILDEGDG